MPNLNELICRIHLLTEAEDLLLKLNKDRGEPIPGKHHVSEALQNLRAALKAIAMETGYLIVEQEQQKSRENRSPT